MTIPDTGPDQFRQFSNPATGESVQFTATPQKAGEDVVRLNWRSMPGGAITEHVHPHQEERFAITVGQAHFTLAGEHRVVGPGETLRVPVGVRHSESNPGAVECVVELRPALHTKEMFEAFGGLGSEGKTTPRGAPKNPLQLGATCWHFRLVTQLGIDRLTGTVKPTLAYASRWTLRPWRRRRGSCSVNSLVSARAAPPGFSRGLRADRGSLAA